MSCASPCGTQSWDVAGIHAAVWVPRAERSCLPLPDTLSMSHHSSSFIPIVPLQNASLPPCDALPSFLSSSCELVFSWAELQAWMPRGRDTVPCQDLGLCLEAQRHLLRASRRAWALGRVLAAPPVLSCSIRSGSTSVPGLRQLYLAASHQLDQEQAFTLSPALGPARAQQHSGAPVPKGTSLPECCPEGESLWPGWANLLARESGDMQRSRNLLMSPRNKAECLLDRAIK